MAKHLTPRHFLNKAYILWQQNKNKSHFDTYNLQFLKNM